MNRDETDTEPLSRRVIGCAFEVSNRLGVGFLESVYENALCIELEAAGLDFERQAPLHVRYKGRVVGSFIADLVVSNSLLIELKATRHLAPEHEAQVINYLRATGLEVALLLNFGTQRLTVRRLVYGHDENRAIWAIRVHLRSFAAKNSFQIHAKAYRHPQHPDHRRWPDRHRPGL